MGYVGNAPAEKYTTIDKQTLTGNSTVGPYTLTHSVGNEQEIEVFVNNVRQEPGVSYTVSSNQLTMSASVASADDFYVIFQGKAKMTATHPPTFDLTAANGTFTGTVTTGGLTVGSDTAKTKFYSDSTYNGIYNGSSLTNNESIYMGSGTLFFYSGGGERMRIDSSGRVGIGTTTHYDSSTKLTVAGRINTSNGTAIGSMNYGGGTVVNVGSMSNHPLQFMTNNITRATIDTNGNVMVGGTTAGNAGTISLNVGNVGSTTGGLQLWSTTAGTHYVQFGDESGTAANHYRGFMAYAHNVDSLTFGTASTERMRIDSSGNLLVGQSTTALPGLGNTTTGISLAGQYDIIAASRTSGAAVLLNRNTDDGSLIEFSRNGTTVGSIGVSGGNNIYISGEAALHSGLTFATNQILPTAQGSLTDGAESLGNSSNRFSDLYLSGNAQLGNGYNLSWGGSYSSGYPTVYATSSSGGYIAFAPNGNAPSANQVRIVGDGIEFGAASSNLNDYEEGSYDVTFSGTSGTPIVRNGAGYYIKIGRMVYIRFYAYAGSNPTVPSGSCYASLPFTADTSNAPYTSILGAYSGGLTFNSAGVSISQRWQINDSVKLTAYIGNWQTNPSYYELSGAGCYIATS